MEMVSLLYVFVYVKLGVVIFKNTDYISGIDEVYFLWEVSNVLLYTCRHPQSSAASVTGIQTCYLIFPIRRDSFVECLMQG